MKKRGSLYSPKSKKNVEQSNFTKKDNDVENDDLGDNENQDDNSKEHYITKAKNNIKEKLKEKFKNEKLNFEENKEQDSNVEVKLFSFILIFNFHLTIYKRKTKVLKKQKVQNWRENL